MLMVSFAFFFLNIEKNHDDEKHKIIMYYNI